MYAKVRWHSDINHWEQIEHFYDNPNFEHSKELIHYLLLDHERQNLYPPFIVLILAKVDANRFHRVGLAKWYHDVYH